MQSLSIHVILSQAQQLLMYEHVFYCQYAVLLILISAVYLKLF